MTLNSVIGAQARISGHIHRTPVLFSQQLNVRAGADLRFKAENLQKVGAFKARGAVNAVLSLPPERRERGLVTHSSGNHGAALAYAGGIAGVRVDVVMPEDAVSSKIAAVKGYGAHVTLCAPTLEARDETSARILNETGGTLVHPYDDDRIIAGQGTAALEFLEQADDLDLLLTPIGGGGLIAGCAVVAKAKSTDIQVFGVEPENSKDAYLSWKSGQRCAPVRTDTIADGLRAGIGERNFACIQEAVDEVLLVSEEAILTATKTLMQFLKTVVEPSAAVPFAAILEQPATFAGRRVGIILSGGNLDLDHLPW